MPSVGGHLGAPCSPAALRSGPKPLGCRQGLSSCVQRPDEALADKREAPSTFPHAGVLGSRSAVGGRTLVRRDRRASHDARTNQPHPFHTQALAQAARARGREPPLIARAERTEPEFLVPGKGHLRLGDAFAAGLLHGLLHKRIFGPKIPIALLSDSYSKVGGRGSGIRTPGLPVPKSTGRRNVECRVVPFEYEMDASPSVQNRCVTPHSAWVTTLVTTQTAVRSVPFVSARMPALGYSSADVKDDPAEEVRSNPH